MKDPENHTKYMQRCMELAAMGLGDVAPNPLVGSVIVHKGTIIGEGYHQKYGGPHAEVNAVNNVPAEKRSLLKESTLYVNLEPCSHHGKTPPCADFIIKENIPEVIIGCEDPFKEVAGKGIERLRKSGCEVKTGVMENEAAYLNRRFFSYHQKKRPLIILKWAQSIDGYMGRSDRKQVWISNNWSKKLVHKWRSEEDAIMVGSNTARHDNPELNVREWKGKDPVRIVIDKELKLDETLHVFDEERKTIVFTGKKKKERKNLTFIKIGFDKDPEEQILKILYRENIQSVIIEGGQQLLTGFIKKELWDEARVLIGNKWIKEGLKAPALHGKLKEKYSIGEDKLYLWEKSRGREVG